MLESFSLKKDRSLAYLHYEGAASSVENAGIAYQSPSLLSAGADAKDIALLNTITNLIFAFLLFKIASLIKFGDALKKSTLVLGTISALGWLPLIIVPIFFKGVSPVLLIILWVINLIPDLMVGPLRDKWLSDLVPSNRVGRYLSLRSIVSASAYLSFFYIMGYALDHFHRGIFSGFTIIFMITFIGSLVSLLLYSIIRVPVPMGEDRQSEFGLGAFILEARQSGLGTFVIFGALIIFATSISSAYLPVYMLQDLHFTYLTFALVISVEFMARITSSRLWGRMIDSAGAVKVLRISSIMIPVIPILWLFSSNPGYLIGIQVISGISWSAFDLCTQSYLFGAASSSKRLHYIVYHRSFITLSAALGPLLGIILLNVMHPIFGSVILGVFLVSGVLRFLVLLTLLPRLKAAGFTVQDYGTQEEFNDYHPESGRAKSQPYLYRDLYREKVEEKWQRIGTENNPFQNFAIGRSNSRSTSKTAECLRQNLLHHPELWPEHKATPVLSTGSYHKVSRLKDNLSRDIEYHKRWASKVTCSGI